MKKLPVITLALALAGGCAFAASSDNGTGTTQGGKASMHQIGNDLRGAMHKIGAATRDVFHRADAAVRRSSNQHDHNA